MSRDVDSLQPAIHAILTRPGVDLNTISAKRVRKQLLAEDPTLSEEWVRENKQVIDEITASVFMQVTPPLVEGDGNEDEDGQLNGDGGESEAGPSETSYRPEEWNIDDVGGDMDGEVDEEKKPAKKAKKSKKEAAMTDEQYAQQLSEQLNSRTRSFRSGVTKGTASKRGRGGKGKNGRRGPISAATVDSEGDDDKTDPMTKKRKKRSGGGGGGAKGGFSKEYALSAPLAAVMQVERLSRPQIVKKLWEYIKGNNLQNPRNKKEILCDDPLRAIFAQDKIGMFKMNQVLGYHLMETSEM